MGVWPRGSAENAERFGTKKGRLLDVLDDITKVRGSFVDPYLRVHVSHDRSCELVVIVFGAMSNGASLGVDLADALDERIAEIGRCEEEVVFKGRMSTLHCIVPFASGGKKA